MASVKYLFAFLMIGAVVCCTAAAPTSLEDNKALKERQQRDREEYTQSITGGFPYWQDKETGCQYYQVRQYSGWDMLVPRIGPDNKIICIKPVNTQN